MTASGKSGERKGKKNQIIRESFSTLSKECQLSTPKTLVQVSLNEIDYWPQIQPFVLYKIVKKGEMFQSSEMSQLKRTIAVQPPVVLWLN